MEIPTRRQDIILPEDLIEEVGRITGLEKIPTTFPISALIPPKKNLNIFWENRVKDALKEAGFAEVYNYSFISEKDAKIFNFSGVIEVENPISEEYKYLRPKIFPNLLKNIHNNQKYFKEIKVFELGKRFWQQEGIIERRVLGGFIAGNFYEVKGAVDFLLNKLGISDIKYVSSAKKTAAIMIGQEIIGGIDEIRSTVLDKFSIKGKVANFVIDFEKLQQLCSEEHEYQPISKYPAAVRDLAVLVPRTTKVVEVLNKLNIAGGKLIRDIDLFDSYEGERLPEGKKNLAFHIIYQSETRTLAAKEIDELQNKIIAALEKSPEWQVRKQHG